MNILLINHYAGSPEMGMEFRPYYFAREWVKAGNNVTIIAGDYSHLRMTNPGVDSDFQEEDIDGIRYVWVKTGYYEGNGSARAFSMFRFVSKLRSHAKDIVRKFSPDAVIASSTYPLDTYAAQKIAKLAGAKLVHEVHDMWPSTLIDLYGMSESHPFIVLMQAGEDSFCKNSDLVVSMLPSAHLRLVEHGMDIEKFAYIPNGISESDWQPGAPAIPDQHRETLTSLREDGKFVVGFFGGHSVADALDILLDAAIRLKDQSNIAFAIVGDGPEKENLIAKAKSAGLENVCFLPPVKKLCIPDLLSYLDCSYIGGSNSPLYRFGVSQNKVFDSMMGRLPLIVVMQSGNSFAKEYRCGIVADSDAPDDVARAIQAMYETAEEERLAMGERGRAAVLENYTHDKLSKRFLDLLAS